MSLMFSLGRISLQRIAMAMLLLAATATLAFGAGERVLHNFIGPRSGDVAIGNEVFDAAGDVYGMTLTGGTSGFGTVYQLSPQANGSWKETVIHNFAGGSDGSFYLGEYSGLSLYSFSRLRIDSAGTLYGVTPTGGAYGLGVLFKLQKDSIGNWTETILYAFGNTGDGVYPGSFAFDRSGNVLGVTNKGGTNNVGVIYQLTPAAQGSWTESILYTFTSALDGAYPTGLTMDSAGNLFGVASQGGFDGCVGQDLNLVGCGTVFELTPGSAASWSFTTVHLLTVPEGNCPLGDPVVDSAGNVYGSTYYLNGYGNGIVFEVSPGANGAWTFSTVYAFAGGPDGGNLYTSLVLGKDGHFYGTSSRGGLYQNGEIFDLIPSKGLAWKKSALFSFNYSDGQGAGPNQPVLDGAGDLYVSTGAGASSVLKLTPSSSGAWSSQRLYSFRLGDEGYTTIGTLIGDSAGNLFGTTQSGGLKHSGAVFELSPLPGGGWVSRTIYSFAGGTDGEFPSSGMKFDASGNLYGTTRYGGTVGCTKRCGTVFELSPGAHGAWIEKVLYRFTGGADGDGPSSSLVMDSAGSLYGATTAGGNLSYCWYVPNEAGCGVIYKLTPDSGHWHETVLYAFHGVDGAFPAQDLALDQAGNLYGAAAHGVSGLPGYGLVFELSPSASGPWHETILYSFSASAERLMPNGLFLAANGTLYGTASNYRHGGVVFTLTPGSGSTWNYQLLYGNSKFMPVSPVVEDSSGNLYGSTTTTVYELIPTGQSWTQSTLHTFPGFANDVSTPLGLTLDPAGHLYGVAQDGGALYIGGGVFQIDTTP